MVTSLIHLSSAVAGTGLYLYRTFNVSAYLAGASFLQVARSPMSCCVVKVAIMPVPILSLKVISGEKQKKGQTFSRLFAALSFHRKCSVRLKCTKLFYFRPGLCHGPCWELTTLPSPSQSAGRGICRPHSPIHSTPVTSRCRRLGRLDLPPPANIDNGSTPLVAIGTGTTFSLVYLPAYFIVRVK